MTITGTLIQELADSKAADAALVRYDDGRYEVRSTIRNADGLRPGHGYVVIAEQNTLDDYCGGVYDPRDADLVASAWQGRDWSAISPRLIRVYPDGTQVDIGPATRAQVAASDAVQASGEYTGIFLIDEGGDVVPTGQERYAGEVRKVWVS